MPIPSKFDGDMGELSDLHGLVMIKLRTLHFAGQQRAQCASVREALMEALEQYSSRVMALAGERK